MDNIYELFKIENIKNVGGLTDELKIIYIYNYFKTKNNNVIILTSSLYQATKFYENLKTYTEDVYLFPMDEFLTSVAIAISPEFKNQRLDTLREINNKPVIVVTNLMGFLRYLPSDDVISKSIIYLSTNEIINRNDLELILNDFGYNRTSLVTVTGEYSIRGFVIDIFPIDSDHPIRVELFGNNIESIKYFDEDSQLSTDKIEYYEIYPYKELSTKSHNSLYDFMKKPIVFNIEKEIINNSYRQLQEEIFEYNLKINSNNKYMHNLEDINIKNEINIGNFILDNKYDFSLTSHELDNFYGDFQSLKNFVYSNLSNKTIVFMLSKERMINEIAELFEYNINKNDIKLNSINIIHKTINKGFIVNNYIFISENDIENNNQSTIYKPSFKMGRKIKSFSDIENGDYVVHSSHGIGIYSGIVTLTKRGFKKDYIQINYLGNDKVYIPVEKINNIYKYSGKDGIKPKIHKLGTTTWAKTKQAVRNKIKDISADLLKLSAERAKSKTIPYLSFPEELIFASDFKYVETTDQTNCIQEIDQDLMITKPMDRLLCGDVGFGKTEVAFRGMFKTILNGHQVAYLCPTTILSKQQTNNAIERFKGYGINIALLNRFTTTKETEMIHESLANGKIDLVFGTHKLLNDKIKYKNLGLLVIDEEQRFGVTHKEKIKSIKHNVNVLTLSATPIPRTLKMAMSGLKDLSILDTAPQNRYPIQTYVIEENDLLIKDAIYKELSRKGQVYFLYNNVVNIEKKALELKKLIPDARICIAHGQMSKKNLENIIEDFVDYKYDILICSTIIETGMDISNVNTLIIIDAQNYGLSQLYQLRGRVGRSNKIAYSYLMYNPTKTLTETAIKRLKAIQEFTELGSGYKIALRDLSIRGAGDLLGSDQAGFIDSVGIDLYTQMVDEVMNELKGEKVLEEETDMSLLNVDTHISDDYVSDENIKIEIHKLINQIKDKESLNNIKFELEDRFGKVNEKTLIYMHEEWFDWLANSLNITQIKQTENFIEITIPPLLSDKINGEKLFLQLYSINHKFKIKYQMKTIFISLPIKDLEKHYIYYLIDLLEAIKIQVV